MPLLAGTDELDREGNTVIASLRGTVIDKGLDGVVIECGGVGYQCVTTPATNAQLARGEEVFVLTAHVVREDSQTLYAFLDSEQRAAFATVQSVSGVGARLAMGILGTLSATELAAAVHAGDVKALQKAPGVGKRLAERMAVDLKGKMPELVAPNGHTAGETLEFPASGAVGEDDTQVLVQVTEALVGLGFSEKESEATARSVITSMPATEVNVSAVLRASLSAMNGGR